MFLFQILESIPKTFYFDHAAPVAVGFPATETSPAEESLELFSPPMGMAAPHVTGPTAGADYRFQTKYHLLGAKKYAIRLIYRQTKLSPAHYIIIWFENQQ